MAKGSRGRRRITSRQFRLAPYSFSNCDQTESDHCLKRCSKALEKKDWEDAMCSVCMECPHNAVLLLCSSHEKGCRPYMCGTSCRYSNCLDQYKKAYTKVTASSPPESLHGSVDNQGGAPEAVFPSEKCEITELACPLCRGQVKGWTVVEPARNYLNAKRRSCMQENCAFVGTYKELRKHVRAEHPTSRPRDVDPILEQKWRRLERERERDDVISTIRSTMPGAMVFGDYVIEGNHYGFDSDEEDGGLNAEHAGQPGNLEVGFDSNLVNVFLLLHAFGQSGNADFARRLRQPDRAAQQASDESAGGFVQRSSPAGGSDASDQDNGYDVEDGHVDGNVSLASRLHRHGRVLLGRSGRRQRRGEVEGSHNR